MKHPTLHLGYSVPRGEAVAIPLKHMAVTGQTQEAGKTTTLEALIHRGAEQGLRALAFVTKRGEGAFDDARQIDAYFQDDAGGRPYWEFVESMAGAAMGGQKMKFERAWIVKASRGAKSLRQVRDNLARLQRDAKRSMDQDIYMLLAEYLDIVIPQLDGLPRATSIDLRSCLNVMDLTGFSDEMQALIIRSALMWVHAREKGVVTIIPEAWKFIPEGRLTPVKPIAERLIREGAGLRNFVWIDSQDIAGVWKLMLRAAAVWVIGVQREANEVKRTLENIPAGVKRPKPADVATLGRGQFFACWGEHVVKTYVQPAWMDERDAFTIASGLQAVDSVHRPRSRDAKRDTPKPRRGGGPNGRRDSAPSPNATALHGDQGPGSVGALNTLERFIAGGQAAQGAVDRIIGAQNAQGGNVTEREAAELRQENADLKAQVRNLQVTVDRLQRQGDAIPANVSALGASFDDIYARVKARLAEEAPALLRVLAEEPELQVEVQRRIIEVKGDTLRGRLALMIGEGWFDEPRTGNAAFNECQRIGQSTAKPNVYRELDKLTTDGFLTKESEGYKAVVRMKRNIKGVER